jgi:hypothetical protein
VFALHQVAEDDAFGPEWPGLDGVLAEELWREPAPQAASAAEAFATLATVWKLSLQAVDLPALDAAERIWAVGPSAIAQLAQRFAERSDLDWAAQVTCIATPAAHRQLAAFAAAVADAGRPARLLAGREAGSTPKGVTLILSEDAAPEDRAAVQAAD